MTTTMMKTAKKMKNKPTSGIQEFRSFNMQIRAVEGEGNERKRIISFSSEQPYERYFGPEILLHSDGAIDLTRLNEIGVVLWNHNRDAVCGKILRAWIENERGCAEIEFDDDPNADVIFKKVDSGTLKGVSVGYMVDAWEEVKAEKMSSNGKYTGPCWIATKWMPYEISIVSIPADASVGVGREINEDVDTQPPKSEKKETRSLAFFERQIQANKNIII